MVKCMGNVGCHRGKDMGSGVTEWVKRNILQWYDHMDRMHDSRLVKKIYRSEVERNGGKG